ncbi:MAG TPA: OmpH family outer membrane protein [Bryobacteraceae bacterium]|jgi:outer membrane protein
MFLKFSSFVLLALAAPFAIEAQAIAPVKMGIVNAQKAVADTQDIKKAQATLEAKYRPRQQAIQQLQNDLQSIQQQLSAANLTPDREAQLRQQGADKQKQLQRRNEDLQSDVNAERQDILGRAGRQMTEVIRKLAEQRGLDVIVDVTNTLYYKPALDLTPAATAAYDQAYPAK